MYISVDVGGTNIRVAGSEALSEIRLVSEVKQGFTSRSYYEDMTFITQSALELAGTRTIEGLGISLPGTLCEDKVELTFANNLKHWEFQPFAKQLRDKLRCSIHAEHDGVAAGVGEAYYGHVPSDFTYIIWGTGIGGAHIRRLGETIEEAYEIVWKDYFIPWEESCGGRILSEKYDTPLADLSKDIWLDIYSDFQNHLQKLLARMPTQNIVFGGGIALNHSDFIGTLGEKYGVGVKLSALGHNSGIYGGFGLIRKHLV